MPSERPSETLADFETEEETSQDGEVVLDATIGIAYNKVGDVPCAICTTSLRGYVLDTFSSSELKEGAETFEATNVIDDDYATAWCEGADGDGMGEWVKMEFIQPVVVAGRLFVYDSPVVE